MIVSALADPQPRTGFIDRCLVAAYDADITPLLCLTKADLAGPEEVLGYYAELDLPYVLSAPDGDLTELRKALAGRVSVMVGHSGVGKSTLVNRLVPDAFRASHRQRDRQGAGTPRTSAVRAPAADRKRPSWIVDTPGVRSFGLALVSADSLLHGFPDLVEGTVDCPPNCEHTETDPECALPAWVEKGHADARRLESYRRLLSSRSGGDGLEGPDRG